MRHPLRLFGMALLPVFLAAFGPGPQTPQAPPAPAESAPAPPEAPAKAEAAAADLVPKIDPSRLPVIEAKPGTAPEAAPPVHRNYPARVIVRIEVREAVKELADGVTYRFWTFGGTVPGPMIRVRRGDLVEFHLMNHPCNTVPHHIDLHAVTSPGGGESSHTMRITLLDRDGVAVDRVDGLRQPLDALAKSLSEL